MKRIPHDPLPFQGNLHKQPYFEGWYYKQVSADGKSAISFIPGVSMTKKDPHCFVQYIFSHENDPAHMDMRTGYVRFPLENFYVNQDPFIVKISDNLFTDAFFSVNLESEKDHIHGKIHLGPFTPLKKNFYMPDIMGPFAYIPHMECYHGVISMSHQLKGKLAFNGQDIDFDGGKGYLEKDWGTNFPRDYVWLQSNHFSDPETSIFFSDAHIPFYGKEFQGYICNLVWKGKQYRFATYTRSRMQLQFPQPNQIHVEMENRLLKLILTAQFARQGNLVAPVSNGMNKMIKEGIAGELLLRIYDKQTQEWEQDLGKMAGIEIVEDR